MYEYIFSFAFRIFLALPRHVALLFNGVNAMSYINVNLPFAGLTGRLNHIQK